MLTFIFKAKDWSFRNRLFGGGLEPDPTGFLALHLPELSNLVDLGVSGVGNVDNVGALFGFIPGIIGGNNPAPLLTPVRPGLPERR